MKHNYITYFKYLEGLLASETLVLFKKLQLDPELDPSAIILQSLNLALITQTTRGTESPEVFRILQSVNFVLIT
jgi:hypothetical protein